MASMFPMQTAYGHDNSTVEEYTPGVGASAFVVGDFVVFSGGTANVAGVDPAAILGFSEVRSEDAKLLTPNGKVPVRQISSTGSRRTAPLATGKSMWPRLAPQLECTSTASISPKASGTSRCSGRISPPLHNRGLTNDHVQRWFQSVLGSWIP
jgi:hypothetical protein